jgi:hypothetical protein
VQADVAAVEQGRVLVDEAAGAHVEGAFTFGTGGAVGLDHVQDAVFGEGDVGVAVVTAHVPQTLGGEGPFVFEEGVGRERGPGIDRGADVGGGLALEDFELDLRLNPGQTKLTPALTPRSPPCVFASAIRGVGAAALPACTRLAAALLQILQPKRPLSGIELVATDPFFPPFSALTVPSAPAIRVGATRMLRIQIGDGPVDWTAAVLACCIEVWHVNLIEHRGVNEFPDIFHQDSGRSR